MSNLPTVVCTPTSTPPPTTTPTVVWARLNTIPGGIRPLLFAAGCTTLVIAGLILRGRQP